MSFKIFACAILFLMLRPGSLGLRSVAMIIPEAIERGKPVTIRCLYDLENDNLYDVKWYKDNEKFCQYTPTEVPPIKIFPISGLEVDCKNSNENQITIIAATSKAQGRYTCLVSVATALFLAVKMQEFMYVVDLPMSYPDLIWEQRRLYRPGMKIKAKCISYDSMPPANLTFYISDVPALPEHVTKSLMGGNGSLWTAYSTLQFVVQKHHIVESKIKLRCAATIYSIFYKSHEQVVQAELLRTTIAPYIWPQRTTAFPKNHTSENRASCNQKNLWLIFSMALIVYEERIKE